MRCSRKSSTTRPAIFSRQRWPIIRRRPRARFQRSKSIICKPSRLRPLPRRRDWARAGRSARRPRSSTRSTTRFRRSTCRSMSSRRRRNASARRCARPVGRGLEMGFVGRSVPRLEDRPLVMGDGTFAADVAFPHMLHMRVVRSGHAHGRIVSIETNAAQTSPGVVAVWTGSDVSDIPPIDFRLTRVEGLAPYRQPILAQQRVRYVGEPVAAVFASDSYAAEDAADLVVIEIEELPVVLDAAATPGEFEPGRSTEPAVVEKSYGDLA